MSRFPFLTISFVALAIIAPFFFPWQYAFLCGIIASFLFPPTVILTGVLIDVLYSGAHVLPYFTFCGVVIAIISYFVQQFLKTRIMS